MTPIHLIGSTKRVASYRRILQALGFQVLPATLESFIERSGEDGQSRIWVLHTSVFKDPAWIGALVGEEDNESLVQKLCAYVAPEPVVVIDKCRSELATWLRVGAFDTCAESEGSLFLRAALQRAKRVAESQRPAKSGAQASYLRKWCTAINHEINNPLGFLSLAMGWIEKQIPDTPDMLSILQDARQSIQRIRTTMADITELSEANVMRPEPTSFQHAMEEAIVMVGPHAIQKARFKIRYQNVPHVCCTPSLLTLAISNLIVNAYQAFESASEDNVIELGLMQDGPDHVIGWVKDTGSGIAKDDIPRIFRPYFTTKRSSQGPRGLGMSIVYSIISNHNGEISVSSELGQGTTFCLRLPIYKKDELNVSDSWPNLIVGAFPGEDDAAEQMDAFSEDPEDAPTGEIPCAPNPHDRSSEDWTQQKNAGLSDAYNRVLERRARFGTAETPNLRCLTSTSEHQNVSCVDSNHDYQWG